MHRPADPSGSLADGIGKINKQMKTILLLIAVCCLFVATAISQTPVASTEQPKTISAPTPVFPDEAKNFIYGSSIRVMMEVDKKGKVTNARAIGPLIPCSNLKDKVAAEINKTAVAAAKAAVFEPILKDGKPVASTLQITYPLRAPETVPKEQGAKMINGGVMNGKALSLPRPDYPPLAKANRASGAVAVQILIGEDGKTLSAAAISGHPYLLEAAAESACRARFAEVLLSGQPVRVSGVITYNFVP